MINVNQITAQLARMPDQALQQYAQMHKDDPYILSLALSESNRRKQMREGAQMSVPEQPKVVDQALADMAAPMPEDVGIAQLPVGDMEFAAGGIVAFDEGGKVPRYQAGGQTERLYRTADGQYFARPLTGQTGYEGMGPGEFLQAFYADLMKKIGPGLSPPERAKAERQRRLEEETARSRQEVAQGSEYSPERYGVTTPAALVPGARGAFFQQPTTVIPTSATPAAAAAKSETGAARTGPGGAGRTQAAGAPGVTPAQQPGGIGDLQKLYGDILAQQEYKDPAEARLAALEIKERTAAQAEKAALERDQARFAEAFKGREERLGKREAAIGEQKDINTGLAFLNAGLAVMSTPGGLATALGKGAQVGTAQFAAGLDKIRSAQEKLDEARDRMEELKLNRDEMNAKEIRAAEGKIRQTGIDAEKRGIDGLRQAAGVTEARAKEIFGKTVQLQGTREEIAGRIRASQISAGAPSANMQMAIALGGGSTPEQLSEGLRKMNEAATGKTDMRTLYATYLSGAQKMPGTEVMSYSQFVGQFAIPVSPGNNPAAAPGTVRERPPGT